MEQTLSPAQAKADRYYLMCERNWIYFLLIGVAGFLGAFTYVLRGNVFCNAQTSNIVLMGMAFGQGNWRHGLYYLIPITAYTLGAFFSELLPNPVKRHLPMRWDTLLIAIEMVVVLVLGFLPETAPVQISQVAINFIASMQYNTFRQAQGTPMGHHLRHQPCTPDRHWPGHGAAPLPGLQQGPPAKAVQHFLMLVYFVGGAVIGTVCCRLFLGKALWVLLLPLGILFGVLLHADLTTEKDLVETKPSGH